MTTRVHRSKMPTVPSRPQVPVDCEVRIELEAGRVAGVRYSGDRTGGGPNPEWACGTMVRACVAE